jgi:hypothetical protein
MTFGATILAPGVAGVKHKPCEFGDPLQFMGAVIGEQRHEAGGSALNMDAQP